MPRKSAEVESLEREVKLLRHFAHERAKDPGEFPYTGCGDSGCIVESSTSRGGQHTNGGCHCEGHKLRCALMFWKARSKYLEDTIREARKSGAMSPLAVAYERLTHELQAYIVGWKSAAAIDAPTNPSWWQQAAEALESAIQRSERSDG